MKKIIVSFVVILLILVSSVALGSNQRQSSKPWIPGAQTPAAEITGDATNISIETITGGFGLTIVLKNNGELNLSDILLLVNKTNRSFVQLITTQYQIPSLAVNETAKIHLRLFGIGLGKILPLPEMVIAIKTSNHLQKEAHIITMVVGLFVKVVSITYPDEVFIGYTLFSPEYSKKTFLMDTQGRIVHTWESGYIQGLGVHLLENGNLLRTILPYSNPVFAAGGLTGGVELYDWNGTKLWEFLYSDSMHCLHHNIKMLPNGHILMIAWEYKSTEEAIAAGRDPASLQFNQLWPDHIIEVEPTSPLGGTIVWEWHVWDHLIQDFDATKENYGDVGDHPELIDINFGIHEGKLSPDLNHINSVDYNEKYDQILLSVHNQNEVWVIDHSTTTEEAAGHTGGRSGMGGDFLYRYGNPRTYRAGGVDDQRLFGSHDAQWIPAGYPGEENILIFNNGQGRPDGRYSSVDEFVPPVDANGSYYLEPGSAYGPDEVLWCYTAEDPLDFYAGYLSGTQRLPNGNTLICDGDNGVFFEVTAAKKLVWNYVNVIPSPMSNQVFKILRYAPEYPGLRFL